MNKRKRKLSARTGRVVGAASGTVFVAAFVAYVVTALLFSAYRIPSEAVTPSVAMGDRVLARHITGRAARRGNIVVFRGELPTSSVDALGNIVNGPPVPGLRVSRVIAIGGDRIDTVNGLVRVNGRMLPERYAATASEIQSSTAIVGRVDYVNLPLY